MLARLGLDRVVGRHDQQREIDAGCAGKHIANEALVAGHVDNAEPSVAERQLGKPQLDGDAPLLLLGQSIGIHAGERLDERRLAVIDVASSAKNEVGGHGSILERPDPPDQRRGRCSITTASRGCQPVGESLFNFP